MEVFVNLNKKLESLSMLNQNFIDLSVKIKSILWKPVEYKKYSKYCHKNDTEINLIESRLHNVLTAHRS